VIVLPAVGYEANAQEAEEHHESPSFTARYRPARPRWVRSAKLKEPHQQKKKPPKGGFPNLKLGIDQARRNE
jgi:hypothetical protein